MATDIHAEYVGSLLRPELRAARSPVPPGKCLFGAASETDHDQKLGTREGPEDADRPSLGGVTRRFRIQARPAGLTVLAVTVLGLSITLISCTSGAPAASSGTGAAVAATATASGPPVTRSAPARRPGISLPAPAALTPFGGTASAGLGRWHPVGAGSTA